ncbi:MAG: prephenate dehydrogenase/arogenate dehydrogenase family protein [Planctomycetota bacterium]
MFDCVGIVGVGLIGASIGLSLKERGLCGRVLGFGRSVESLRAAERIGAIDAGHVGLSDDLKSAQLVVICAPVDRIVDLTIDATAFTAPEALITDAGSTKARIVAALTERLPPHIQFVGSHPIAGREKTGPTAALADLFKGKTCVVTPVERTPLNVIAQVSQFWDSLGMDILILPPDRHDELLARTSHLPHLIASALASLLGDDEKPLAGSGFRDTTRIAAGSPELWTAIFEQNRPALLKSLDEYTRRLEKFRAALESNDSATLKELLSDGKSKRDALGS